MKIHTLTDEVIEFDNTEKKLHIQQVIILIMGNLRFPMLHHNVMTQRLMMHLLFILLNLENH